LKEQIASFLKSTPTLEGLTHHELKALAEISDIKKHQSNEVVFSMTDDPIYLFIIMTGTVKLFIDGSEYNTMTTGDIFGEIGIINETVRSGDTIVTKEADIIRINGAKIFDEKHLSPTIALKLVRLLSKKISGYLITRDQASTQEIIKRGEGEFVEFKSTMRMNLRTGQRDIAIEKASLKTIAAFLNSKGGTLLIGVADDGEVLGLEADRFPNDDKMLLHITNLIKGKIGSIHLKYVHLKLVTCAEKQVLRIDCKSSTSPAYLIMDSKEDFYIRTGPSTTSMRLSKIHGYISQRFGEHIT
jgi:CRP-like cAMP-binding protein